VAVVEGRALACRAVRLACARYLQDLKTGPSRGLRWSLPDALRAIEFFPDILRLAEGEHAGKPFVLSPFQQFIIGNLFGWFGVDGYRRFRTAYIEIGKGSGKSPLAAGIGLFGLVADGEEAAQIYSAATTKEQAKIVWNDAQRMVAASPVLAPRVRETVNNLAFLQTGSFFRPVASDESKLDGFRPHMVLADEVHEHPSGHVIDKMRAGFKGRRQPLLIEITNAGFDRHSICYQHHELSLKVLEGTITNDSWFAFVCGLDPCDTCYAEGHRQPKDGCAQCDDWRNPAVWRKANPNLGVSVTEKYLTEQVQEARDLPAKENIVRRLSFCQWTEQATRWIGMDVWDRNGGDVPEAALAGQPCVGALDLSSVSDLTALGLVFPLADGRAATRWRFWCPEENILTRAKKDRVPYDVWARQGLLTPTPGNVVDYDRVRDDILALGKLYRIQELAVDPWNATETVSKLQEEGVNVFLHRQGYASMNVPTKALEVELKAGRVLHGGHPILRWMASNVTVTQDPAGNLKPDKERSPERIDGIVCLIMALGRALSQPAEKRSIYETRGVRAVG
jgi:phage terminase large subunit-like protein